MNQIQENMSFRTYYSSLKNLHVSLRMKICDTLEISTKTFYNKLNDDSFDYPQKVVIAQIVEKDVEELFPGTLKNEAV